MKVVLIVIGWMLKVAGVGLLGWLLLSGSVMFVGDGTFMLKMLWVMLRCLSKVDLRKMLKLLEKKGLGLDLECVYSVNFSGKKMLIAYQGNIEIDRDKVAKKWVVKV